MIMKVMTYANDRKTVIEKMRSVLHEIIIEGVATNTDLCMIYARMRSLLKVMSVQISYQRSITGM